jgi:Domain of unknown function (DUF4178)
MESNNIKPRDVISYLGRDYLVEGVLGYKLNGKFFSLAKAVDGDTVLWVEPIVDAIDDRLLLMTEVHDLDVVAPPPQTIFYRKSAFLPRLAGTAVITLDGVIPERPAGTFEFWRYRAAGDLFLQIEARPAGTIILFGEAIHKSMVDVLPA